MSGDIEPGLIFFNELVGKLKQADFTILCLTHENMRSLWMIFEAGVVLGRSDITTKVCPYLVDLSSRRRNLPEPLKNFWALKANKEDTYELVRDINRAAGNALSELELDRVFEKKWPELEALLESIGPAPARVSPRVCIDDYENVRACIYRHQKQLEVPFESCIKTAIADYDRTSIIELVDQAIEENKRQFKGAQSLLVGDIYDFLSENFTKEHLRDIIIEMEGYMFSSSSPEQAGDRLTNAVLRSSYKVFSNLQRILLDRFYACLVSAEE